MTRVFWSRPLKGVEGYRELLADDLAEPCLEYELSRNRQSRRISLRFKGSGHVLVTAPSRVSLSQVDAFIGQHLDWLAEQERRYRQVEAQLGIPPFEPKHLGQLLLLGQRASIELGASYSRLVENQHGLLLKLALPLSSSPEEVSNAISQWCKQEARERIGLVFDRLIPRAQKRPQRWQLSGAKTRWGVCTDRQSIRISWRLIFLPPEAMTYVVAHELAHLVYFDHSPAFWEEVNRIDPDSAGHIAMMKRWRMSFTPNVR